MKKLLVTLVTAALVIGCGGKTETTATAANGTEALTATAAAAAAAASGLEKQTAPVVASTPSGQLTGTVLETFNAAGYSYVRLQTASGEEWAAVRETDLKKGQKVAIIVDMTAEKFESKTLKRTFDKIVFGTVAGEQAAASAAVPAAMQGEMPKGHPSTGAMGANAMGTPADHMKPKVDVGNISVPKADGADAKTVAEVWGAKSSINGKPVVVRGKVVKYLGGIMGKNWIHLRDGSGSDAKGDNDLTITTDAVVAVGDVVVVSGKVSVNKDFGAGYQYPVIVENASVRK